MAALPFCNFLTAHSTSSRDISGMSWCKWSSNLPLYPLPMHSAHSLHLPAQNGLLSSSMMIPVGVTLLQDRSFNFPFQYCLMSSSIFFIISFSHFSLSSLTAVLTLLQWLVYSHFVPVTVKMASNNSSEPTDFVSSFEVNSYLVVNVCTLILFALPGLVLNGLVAVALAGELEKKQGRAQWIILLNISLAGLVTTLTLGSVNTSRLLFLNNVQGSAVWLCCVSHAAFHIIIAILTVSLALLSVVVCIIIKHGLSKVKLFPLIAAIVILWVVLCSQAYLTSHQLTNMKHFVRESLSVTVC